MTWEQQAQQLQWTRTPRGEYRTQLTRNLELHAWYIFGEGWYWAVYPVGCNRADGVLYGHKGRPQKERLLAACSALQALDAGVNEAQDIDEDGRADAMSL